jgi:peptide-methionine (S)-S-oxide reductase
MNRTASTAVVSMFVLLVAAIAVFASRVGASRHGDATLLPAPLVHAGPAASAADPTAVFAGGCFWGIEAVFEHLKGVSSAVSGYAGGASSSPSYDDVSSGTTGHAEAVQVVYDPSQISYETLLHVFFSVAHDPTQLNRQGPDVGTQYRSAIFYGDDDQKRAAKTYISQLTNAKVFDRPIVTEVVPLRAFYRAEEYHQNYMARHPASLYIVINDAPKVERLRREFPALYQESPRD